MRNTETIPTNDVYLRQVPSDDLPILLGEVERVRAILWARLIQVRPAAPEPRVRSAAIVAEAPPAAVAAADRDPDKLVTVANAADLLGVSRSTLYQLMETGARFGHRDHSFRHRDQLFRDRDHECSAVTWAAARCSVSGLG